MKRIYTLALSLAGTLCLMAQPDQWAVAIDPVNDVNLPKRIASVVRAAVPPVIDGTPDKVWDTVGYENYDRYIKYHTKYEAGVYSQESDLPDNAAGTNRLPDNEADFKGSYKLLYDDDYIYILFNINDNEINDGSINPINEELEFQEAPYPDSAQQLLGGKPFPPYTGSAGYLNQTYCYWGYLGAFKMMFKLRGTGTGSGDMEVTFRQKADAIAKINYDQRAASCKGAWTTRKDGAGYFAEVAISLKIALADSDGNSFTPIPVGKPANTISFEMKVIDQDLNQRRVQASWNAENNNVWDAMCFSGKLTFFPWAVGVKESTISNVSFFPNPATDQIQLSEKAASVEIVSVNGVVEVSAANVQNVNVADLAAGMYMVKINGKAAGKLLKQ